MTEKEILKKLEKDVKLNGPCHAACYLGYKSANTIEKWIKKKSIPKNMHKQVIEYLNLSEVMK